MKKRFYRVLQKHLRKIGIYTQYFPTARAIHYHLKSKPIVVQNYGLEKLSSSIKASNNHEFYSVILQKFVPSWKLNILEAAFISESGGGESSLNSFRKVRVDDNWYFEKVYFNSRNDLDRVMWFDRLLWSKLESYGINTPKLYWTMEGEAFTIAYFDFLNLIRISNDFELENSLIAIVEKLYQASFDASFIQTENMEFEYLKDFKNHLEYENNKNAASKRILNEGILNEVFEVKAKNSRAIITHGDLHEKNIYKNLILIDWDNFGLYPIGFDPAFLYFRFLTTGRMKDYSPDWLEKNFKSIIKDKDWVDFERNFYYFFFVFSSNHLDNEEYMWVMSHVVEKLKFHVN